MILRLEQWNYLKNGRVKSEEAQQCIENAWMLYWKYRDITDVDLCKSGLVEIENACSSVWDVLFGQESG